jgi:CheY-like chemotaxis protein
MTVLENSLPRLLVIDDELGIRDLVRFAFEGKYIVVTAASGDDALAECERQPFDLVICDLAMPGKDGIETFTAIKKTYPDTEVVVVTGKVALASVVECIKMGAYDFVMKPFDLDYLRAILNKALEHRRMRTQLGGLRRINQIKSELFFAMGNQLNDPAQTILKQSKVLLESLKLPDSQKMSVKEIQGSAEKLMSLIDHLFDLSVRPGKTTPATPSDWQALLQHVNQLKEADSPSVLVVDDDPLIIELFEVLLRRQGFTVETAQDGLSALQKMNRQVPRILLLDLMMPKMSGFELLEAMAKDNQFREVRIFIITAKQLTAAESKFLEQRVEAVVQKGKQGMLEILPMLKEHIVDVQPLTLHDPLKA